MHRPDRTPDDFRDVPLSALIRAAGRAYGEAAYRAQVAAGCDDLPPTGGFILSAMHWNQASLESVIRWMGVSKQSVSQTVDALVVHGYLERAHDAVDRRRVNLTLTDRGRTAGAAARAAVERVDRKLAARVGPRKVAHARETLGALILLGRSGRPATGRGPASD